MIAICFACGKEKNAPFDRCDNCSTKPVSGKDKINSLCLSNHCLSEKNLLAGSRYIRQHRKMPKINEKILDKATKLFESIPQKDESDQANSYEFTDSFFDFQGLSGEAAEKGETITVHAIGKPLRDDGPPGNIGNKEKTYQKLQWELGKDISFDEAEEKAGKDGELYVWYRWMTDKWIWKYVSKREFSRLRAIENVADEE